MSSGATYIAVVIVLVILIGFVLTMANMLAKTAGSKIRSDMQKVISTYDAIIAMKAKEINQMKDEKTNSNYNYEKRRELGVNLLQGTPSTSTFDNQDFDDNRIPISSFIIPSVSYRSNILADNYEDIKNSFAFNDRAINNEIDKIEKDFKHDKFVDACQRIIKGLSYDALYELITLKGIEQVELLKKGLHANDKVVLDRYLEIIDDEEKFDGVKFYDWIKRSIAENSDEIEVRTSSNKNEDEFDPSICDGYRIYVGNKMYDYAISKKDVS